MRFVMKSLLLFALAILIVEAPALAMAGGAKAAADNDDCLACHSVAIEGHGHAKVDYTAPPVGYGACPVCHSQPNHYNHGSGAGNEMLRCSGDAECHPRISDAVYFADTFTPYGSFDNAGSLGKSASEIHALHVQRTNRFRYPYLLSTQCANCHNGVACAVCHRVPPAHAQHTYDASLTAYVIPPAERTVSTGSGHVAAGETCVISACHASMLDDAATWRPSCIDCHAGRAGKHGSGPVEVGY
jgi:hypothetical protein